MSTKKIKVLHVINSLNRGGAETMLLKIVSQLDHDKFENYVISLLGPGRLDESVMQQGGVVRHINLKSINVFGEMLKYFSLVRSIEPDVIQGWMYYGNLIALFGRAKKAKGKATVIWNIRHSLSKFGKEKMATRLLIWISGILSKKTYAVIYNSSEAQETHIQKGYERTKAKPIPNGFNTDLFSPNEINRLHYRKSLGINDDDLVFGVVARFHPDKGHANLLIAIKNCNISLDKIKFVFIGRDADVDHFRQANYIGENFATSSLICLGERDDVHNLFPMFDWLVLPSRTESFPNVIGEAMACGIPCIATNVGGAAEIINGNGIVVPAEDPIALGKAIKKASEFLSGEKEELGENCRKSIVENYSIQSIADQYEELYSAAIEDCD